MEYKSGTGPATPVNAYPNSMPGSAHDDNHSKTKEQQCDGDPSRMIGRHSKHTDDQAVPRFECSMSSRTIESIWA